MPGKKKTPKKRTIKLKPKKPVATKRAKIVARKPGLSSNFKNWRRPSLDKAQGDISRAIKELKLNQKKFETAVRKSKNKELRELTDREWQSLQNSDSWDTNNLNEVRSAAKGKNYRSITKSIKGNTRTAAPIVLFQKGKKPVVIGDDTSLMVAKALGVRPKVLPIDAKENISESAILRKKKANDPFFGKAGEEKFDKLVISSLERISQKKVIRRKVAASLTTIIGSIQPVQHSAQQKKPKDISALMLSDKPVDVTTLKRKGRTVRNRQPKTLSELLGVLAFRMFVGDRVETIVDENGEIKNEVKAKGKGRRRGRPPKEFSPTTLSELLGFKSRRAFEAFRRRMKVPNPQEAPNEALTSISDRDLLKKKGKGAGPGTGIDPGVLAMMAQFGGKSAMDETMDTLTNIATGSAGTALAARAKSMIKAIVAGSAAFGKNAVKYVTRLATRATATVVGGRVATASAMGTTATWASRLFGGAITAYGATMQYHGQRMTPLTQEQKKKFEEFSKSEGVQKWNNFWTSKEKSLPSDPTRKREISVLEARLKEVDDQIVLTKAKMPPELQPQALFSLNVQRNTIIDEIESLGGSRKKYEEEAAISSPRSGPQRRPVARKKKQYRKEDFEKLPRRLAGGFTPYQRKPIQSIDNVQPFSPTSIATNTFKNRIGATLNPSYGSYLSAREPFKQGMGTYNASAGGYSNYSTRAPSSAVGSTPALTRGPATSPNIMGKMSTGASAELLSKGVVPQGAQGGALGPGLQPGQVPSYTSGKYRPPYKLSDIDLSDDVVNTIAGEARNDQTSIDGVVNNMFNRVGSQNWNNLQQVARAPGQYTGYRKATPEQAKMIRDRIRAIASGNEPDITDGATEYRASWYVKGQGAGKTFARKAEAQGNRDIGGNIYAKTFEPGPYAASAKPQDQKTHTASVDWNKSQSGGGSRNVVSPIPGKTVAELSSVKSKTGETTPGQRRGFLADRSFRSRSPRLHAGTDYFGGPGDPVVAAEGGKVIRAQMQNGYGYTVDVQHNDQSGKPTHVTRYSHLQPGQMNVGDSVKSGEKIGTMDGASHLHFEVRDYDAYKQDPFARPKPGMNSEDAKRLGLYNPSDYFDGKLSFQQQQTATKVNPSPVNQVAAQEKTVLKNIPKPYPKPAVPKVAAQEIVPPPQPQISEADKMAAEIRQQVEKIKNSVQQGNQDAKQSIAKAQEQKPRPQHDGIVHAGQSSLPQSYIKSVKKAKNQDPGAATSPQEIPTQEFWDGF